jgi:hypothetical protein
VPPTLTARSNATNAAIEDSFYLRMICSENRFTLFRIMR